jgi:stage II sporulation protein D
VIRTLALLAVVSCAIAAEPVYRVRIAGKTVELGRERYVAAVLEGESSVFRSDEALKAMSVAARTYAVRHRGRHLADGYDFCATTHCQRVDMDAITPRLESIAAATAGELLWQEGRPALTLYSLDCGGRTDKNLADPYCMRAGSTTWTWRADPRQVAEALTKSQLRTPDQLRGIEIVERSGSGRAVTLALVGSSAVRISAESFRLAVGRALGWNTLRSDLYEVRDLVFQGRGAGHGTGLCQRGADQMGIEGRGYREILAFYYPGTKAGVNAQGISWQRLCGNAVCIETTNAQDDRDVLASAERILSGLPLPAPQGIEIRVYPDLDRFRDATGEPGWVAAHTSGRRIHLQPVTVLRSRNALDGTLRHELLHVAIETQARADLPLWFREGLALYLEGGARAGDARIPSDAELRRTDDRAAARRAYEQSGRAVAGLVERYGREAVFGWLKLGLPPEVTKPSNSQAPVNNR